MANKQTEYNRGRMQGLDMAYRLLMSEGMPEAAEKIADEIRARGGVPVNLGVTTKEGVDVLFMFLKNMAVGSIEDPRRLPPSCA